MIKFEDECVGCPTELGCIGEACRYRNVPHVYCDICGEEIFPDEVDCSFDTLLDCKKHYHTRCLDSEEGI